MANIHCFRLVLVVQQKGFTIKFVGEVRKTDVVEQDDARRRACVFGSAGAFVALEHLDFV